MVVDIAINGKYIRQRTELIIYNIWKNNNFLHLH